MGEPIVQLKPHPGGGPDQPGLPAIALALLGALLFEDADQHPPEGAEELYLLEKWRGFGTTEAAARGFRVALRSPGERDATLVRLARRLGLCARETAAVALALAVETDAMAGRAVAYLQAPVGGSRPTLGLLARALAPLADEDGASAPEARLAAGPACRFGVLTATGQGPLPERSVSLPVGLVYALTGCPPVWAGMWEASRSDYETWPASVMAALDGFAAGLTEDCNTLLVIRNASRLEQDAIVRSLAKALGRRPVYLDPARLEVPGFGALVIAAGLLPAFVCDPAPGEYLSLPEPAGWSGPMLAFTGCDGRVGCGTARVVTWSVPLPSAAERAALWRESLPDPALAHRLGVDHLQSAGRIRELCEIAGAYEALQTSESTPETTLREAFWLSEGSGLGALAHPVREQIPDDALVLGGNLRSELRLLLARCRHRETLADDLGVTMGARYKVGVRGLFVGPSGTGKTLAVSWLANRLGLPLYRVDLAAVTSKYIGETERNLAKLLARAEQEEVVLLFDEADSMFGKRTDIQDSNDRFANAQTNYLLQRIETYSGIVILTSNAKSRFDEAFTRRIDMIVEFLQPEPRERRTLWKAHLGNDHAVRPAELNRIASLAELAGGHIRNVVLTAAVLARVDQQPIALRHLQEGLKAEYRKLGWTVPAELLVEVDSQERQP